MISQSLGGTRTLHYAIYHNTAGESPLHGTSVLKPFASTTQAVLRYLELWDLLANPRSIPLDMRHTHVGKSDSRGRWLRIQAEFAQLIGAFPKAGTVDWYLLVIPRANNLMPQDQVKLLEEKTGQGWTRYRYDRYVDRAYRDLADRLRERGLVADQEPQYHSKGDSFYKGEAA